MTSTPGRHENPVVEIVPRPEDLRYTFGGAGAPLATVAPGSVIEMSCEDCFGGRVRTAEDLPSVVCEFPYLNPVTGPIHVEGADPGDLLAVHFADIRPARDWAVSATFPHFGALTAPTSRPCCIHRSRKWCGATTSTSRRVPAPSGHAALTTRVVLPLDPMHGTVGVAPAAGEVIMSITPGAHGGNMDTPEIRAGTTVYLPVNVPGAMLAIGDGHCRQGEGEVCGTAVEAAMRTVIVVDVVKGAALGLAAVGGRRFVMSTGSARPLEDAFRISQHDMVGWVSDLLELDELDAYQLVSQVGLAPTGNVVDTTYTMVAKVPKAVLGGRPAYHGIHERLRRIGRDHVASRRPAASPRS